MISLPTTNVSLEIDLDGAVATNQLPWTVTYAHINSAGKETLTLAHGLTNSGTAVTLVAAPTLSGERRIIKNVSVYNADTASRTVVIQINDNSTTRTIVSIVLATLEHLIYEEGNGWYCLSTSGGIK